MVGSFISVVLVRSRIHVKTIVLLIVLAIIISFPICYLLDFPILFLKIWIGGQALAFWYLLYDLHYQYKAVRRYPGTLSKFKSNPNISEWSSEEKQYYLSTYLVGTDESNKALLDLVYADMKAVRKVILPYITGMKGGRKIALYVVPNEGCLWEAEDKGSWVRLQNKYTGSFPNDYIEEQKVLVGYFYVK